MVQLVEFQSLPLCSTIADVDLHWSFDAEEMKNKKKSKKKAQTHHRPQSHNNEPDRHQNDQERQGRRKIAVIKEKCICAKRRTSGELSRCAAKLAT